MATRPAFPKPANRERLRLSDVRRALRLVGDVREVGTDPDAWRPLLIRGLHELFGGSMAVSSEVYLLRDASRRRAAQVADVGWMLLHTGGASNVLRVEQVCDEPPEGLLLSVRGDVADPETEAAVEPAVTLRRGDHMLMSQVALRHVAAVDQLAVHRTDADAAYGRATARLLRLIHVELARFWRRDVLRRTADPAADLAPRLAQTLERLLEGASEKEIAADLGLSPHTVHNYVKALHQRFDVRSRGELLHTAGKAKAVFRPRLNAELPRSEQPDG